MQINAPQSQRSSSTTKQYNRLLTAEAQFQKLNFNHKISKLSGDHGKARHQTIVHAIKKVLEILVAEDLEFVVEGGLIERIWRIIFYNNLDGNMELIEEGIGYWSFILWILENQQQTSLSQNSKNRMSIHHEHAKMATYDVYLYLGDLNRYKGQQKEEARSAHLSHITLSMSQFYYKKAADVFPWNGRAHNQLAVIACTKHSLIEAYVNYLCSLCALHPFDKALENLASLSDKIVRVEEEKLALSRSSELDCAFFGMMLRFGCAIFLKRKICIKSIHANLQSFLKMHALSKLVEENQFFSLFCSLFLLLQFLDKSNALNIRHSHLKSKEQRTNTSNYNESQKRILSIVYRIMTNILNDSTALNSLKDHCPKRVSDLLSTSLYWMIKNDWIERVGLTKETLNEAEEEEKKSEHREIINFINATLPYIDWMNSVHVHESSCIIELIPSDRIIRVCTNEANLLCEEDDIEKQQMARIKIFAKLLQTKGLLAHSRHEDYNGRRSSTLSKENSAADDNLNCLENSAVINKKATARQNNETIIKTAINSAPANEKTILSFDQMILVDHWNVIKKELSNSQRIQSLCVLLNLSTVNYLDSLKDDKNLSAVCRDIVGFCLQSDGEQVMIERDDWKNLENKRQIHFTTNHTSGNNNNPMLKIVFLSA